METEILRAVVLGDKSGLDPETRQDFSSAGAMHILAVSGLHVGLIWFALRKILFMLTFLPGGERIRSAVVITLLIFYAFMAGLSPSVCRSVLMFSLFSISTFLARPASSVNNLLLSALILLVMDPYQIRDAGFQLSYLAVGGIMAFQPLFSSILYSRRRITRWILDMLTVSFAAQIATAPVSIFYFHQFPNYFPVTNLLGIPLLSVMVGTFIFSVPFLLLQIMDGPILKLLFTLSGLMAKLMESISGIPGSTINGLYLSLNEVVLIMCILLFIYLLLRYRKVAYLFPVLLAAGMLMINASGSLFTKQDLRRLVIGHFNNGTLIMFQNGEKMESFISSGDSVSVYFMEAYLASQPGSKSIHGACNCIDSIQELSTDHVVVSRMSAGCWIIGNCELKVLFVKENYDPALAGFFRNYPCDVILLSGFRRTGKLEKLSFHPGAAIVMDGSCSSGSKAFASLIYPGIYLTDSDGAFVKYY